MKLEDCLRAIETGTSTQDHADWLRIMFVAVQWAGDEGRHWDLESMFVEKSRWAKAWRQAAKYYKQRTRFCETDYFKLSQKWIGDVRKLKRERDALQVKLTTVTEELDGYRDWEQGTLGKALLRIANTDEAFVKLRGERDELQAELKARDKQKCHTCRHLRSGMKCMVCELLHIHTETATFGCTLWEEVDTHD